MLKPFYWNQLTLDQKTNLLQRPLQEKSSQFQNSVKQLVEQVKIKGDSAVRSMTKQFDRINLDEFQVTPTEMSEAWLQVTEQTKAALQHAQGQISRFHQVQKLENKRVETLPGIVCESIVVPIERVGLYVPGGTAPLVSTVLMLGVPAQIAECPLRILCTPPNAKGNINPAIIVAANLCGIEQIYKVGGAQAIAAMAYGTDTIPKVDKIVGPGNRWVTVAKQLVALDANGASIDMPAGPSEVLVIADEKANPNYVAADLLAQAEHGSDSQVILVSLSSDFAEQVLKSVQQQLAKLYRKDVTEQALQFSRCFIAENIAQAIEISNQYAPEHLIIQVENARQYVPLITSAGSVFLGEFTPETAGDYASGTNHVLPTGGCARSISGLTVRDFVKTISIQELSQEGLAAIADTIRVLTELEGLDAHRQAMEIRLK